MAETGRIEFDFDPGARFVTLTVFGECTFDDFRVAVAKAVEYPTKPILWNLSAADSAQIIENGIEIVNKLVQANSSDMSFEKRAFLVVQRQLHAFLENMLGDSKVPWPWAVFSDARAAEDWLCPPAESPP